MTRAYLLLSPLLAGLWIMPASAAQSLAPTPYPSSSPGVAPLNPAPMGTGVGQGVMATPYPQDTGGTSQGNPTDMTTGGGQHRVPSTYRQKYGTDQK